MAGFEFDDAEILSWMERVGSKAEPSRVKQSMTKSMVRVKTQSMRSVKSKTPVDTGQLRRAWTTTGPSISGAAIEVEIANNTEYAPFVEFGHRTRGGGGWVPGVHMLTDSLKEVEGQLSGLITPEFQKVLEDLLN